MTPSRRSEGRSCPRNRLGRCRRETPKRLSGKCVVGPPAALLALQQTNVGQPLQVVADGWLGLAEGFDQLYYVRLLGVGRFETLDWNEELPDDEAR